MTNRTVCCPLVVADIPRNPGPHSWGSVFPNNLMRSWGSKATVDARWDKNLISHPRSGDVVV